MNANKTRSGLSTQPTHTGLVNLLNHNRAAALLVCSRSLYTRCSDPRGAASCSCSSCIVYPRSSSLGPRGVSTLSNSMGATGRAPFIATHAVFVQVPLLNV